LIAAGLHRHLFGEEQRIAPEHRRIMDDIASRSFAAYDALKKHPSFVSYLEKKSTLRFYKLAKVGSRPASRSVGGELSLDDLRAIPFVGSWSQLKQNVPGYYGIGAAFEALAEEGHLEDLKTLFRQVPFFRTLMLNSMMALSKCSFELTAYMAEDPEFGDFWELLHAEYERSLRMLLEVSGSERLMQSEPVSAESIRIREDLVVPLLIIQQYALMKVEEDVAKRTVYEKIVTRSLYGNINASRNSA
jgi:phosphoenolpyruvate carboxylase